VATRLDVTLPLHFTLSGDRVNAAPTDTYAAAAMASDQRVLSRSLKYHRPRGAFCFEGHCSGCLVRIDGVPNLRACQAQVRDGCVVESQNAFPSASFDVLGAVDHVYRQGMDHHTLMTGATVLNKVVNKVVRQLSGLGRLPSQGAATLLAPPESISLAVDVAIIGGGPSGLAAAAELASHGYQVLLLDQQPQLGGSYWSDPRTGKAAVERAVTLATKAGATLLHSTSVVGFFDDEHHPGAGVLVATSAADHGIANETTLLRISARRWMWAAGGYAVNLAFDNNDRPGVIAARGLARLRTMHNIVAGRKVALVLESNPAPSPELGSRLLDFATALATSLANDGSEGMIVPQASVAAVQSALVGHNITGLLLKDGTTIECDTVAVVATPAPASEGPRMQGCAVQLNAGGYFVVVGDDGQTSVPNVFAAGDVTGFMGQPAAAHHGRHVAASIIASLRNPQEQSHV
jgi:sarcosine oxidase, subunit alpha